MKWDRIDEQPCSIARALSEIGDRWTLLVLREAFMRTRRFGDFVARTGAARNLVADRLQKLVDADILEKRRYQERPERFEYRLTEKGRDLYPVILSLFHWGDRWLDDGKGRSVEHVHRGCGETMHGALACSECGEVIGPRDVEMRPGPGFANWLAYRNRNQRSASADD